MGATGCVDVEGGGRTSFSFILVEVQSGEERMAKGAREE